MKKMYWLHAYTATASPTHIRNTESECVLSALGADDGADMSALRCSRETERVSIWTAEYWTLISDEVKRKITEPNVHGMFERFTAVHTHTRTLQRWAMEQRKRGRRKVERSKKWRTNTNSRRENENSIYKYFIACSFRLPFVPEGKLCAESMLHKSQLLQIVTIIPRVGKLFSFYCDSLLFYSLYLSTSFEFTRPQTYTDTPTYTHSHTHTRVHSLTPTVNTVFPFLFVRSTFSLICNVTSRCVWFQIGMEWIPFAHTHSDTDTHEMLSIAI